VSKAFTTNCFTGDEPTNERGEETEPERERDRGAEAEEEEDEEQDSKADAATCANSR